MAITDFTANVQLFTAGRAPGPALAVVLHEYCSDLGSLDLDMERCARPRPAQSPGCHRSFHYGIGGANIHQYVLDANTAWGFGLTPPSCPEPLCPPNECESCTGLTVAQYNPDLDGNPPVLPAFVAGADGTANNNVIHVAVTGACSRDRNDCCVFLSGSRAYENLVAALAEIFAANPAIVPSQNTLLVHCGELPCLDIDQLVEDILAFPVPEPFVPCECITDVDPGDGLAMAITSNTIVTDLVIDPDPDNIITVSPTGLLAVNSGAPGILVGTPAPNTVFNPNTDPANRLLVVTNAPGDTITITTPLNANVELFIKNAGPEDLIVATSGAELIDGVATITLAATDPGNYPFGNNGGESVQLIWNGANWFVL